MADFDADFELAILGEALRDPGYAKRATRICDAHHFGSKERSWVWDTINDTFKKFGEVPSGSLFIARATDQFKDKDKRKPYLKVVQKLMKSKPAGPGAALEELETFVRFVNAQLALEKSADALEKGNLDECYAAMAATTRLSIGKTKYTLINWIEDFEDRQEARKFEHDHPEDIVSVPTGWPTIDKITGGHRIGELNLLMGTTGRGKSIAINNVAYAACKRNYNTLIVGFEMPARQIASRADSRWLGMDYKAIQAYDLTPTDLRSIKARHKKAKKHFKNRLKIASFPVRSASIEDVRGLLEDIRIQHDGWRPQVICLDSADHLLAIENRKEAFRLQQAEVYWSAKALAEEESCVVWSSTHAGKEWAGKTATAEASKESYDKSQIADVVITINDPNYEGASRKKAKVELEDGEGFGDDDEPDDDNDDAFTSEIKARLLEFHLAKVRDGESLRTIKMMADFKKMLIEEAA